MSPLRHSPTVKQCATTDHIKQLTEQFDLLSKIASFEGLDIDGALQHVPYVERMHNLILSAPSYITATVPCGMSHIVPKPHQSQRQMQSSVATQSSTKLIVLDSSWHGRDTGFVTESLTGSDSDHAASHGHSESDRSLQCPDCGYKTRYRGHLNCHMQSHSRKSLYCPYCSFKTSWLRSLQRHAETLHPGRPLPTYSRVR